MHEYDLIAEWYATDRDHGTGIPEVTALSDSLPRGATVLDVGCGNGIPITRRLLAAGHSVLGVDSSTEMLRRFQVNCPGTPYLHAAIQTCDLEGRAFDAAVAWGVIFHLTREDQVRAFEAIARAVKPGGPFLFTAGDKDGSIDGQPMNGVPFRYHSFSVDGYRDVLANHGLTLEDVHTDSGGNVYYLARRRQG